MEQKPEDPKPYNMQAGFQKARYGRVITPDWARSVLPDGSYCPHPYGTEEYKAEEAEAKKKLQKS